MFQRGDGEGRVQNTGYVSQKNAEQLIFKIFFQHSGCQKEFVKQVSSWRDPHLIFVTETVWHQSCKKPCGACVHNDKNPLQIEVLGLTLQQRTWVISSSLICFRWGGNFNLAAFQSLFIFTTYFTCRKNIVYT